MSIQPNSCDSMSGLPSVVVSSVLARATEPEEHDEDVAYLLAAACAWAYARDEFELVMRQKFNHDFHVDHFAIANDALLVDANAYLIRSENGEFGVLCFQGTAPKNVTQWLLNANTRMVQFVDIGRVHDGFYRNVEIVRPRFRKALARALGVPLESEDRAPQPPFSPIKRLYITGHSLGGGMAALASAMLWNDHDQRLRDAIRSTLHGVYTFGQPMVGDHVFVETCEERFGARVFRHVYKHDLVPRLPPRTTGSFAHFGKEYYCAEQGWLLRPKAISQVYTALLTVPIGAIAWGLEQFAFARWVSLPFSMSDHSPINYLWCSGRHRAIELLAG
ncbi:lipase family protein [Sorangium sp. So ce693]|uniref:lipase family protein n=1 Tax=Sorangium sp. So ce693 TaxID=3133318 RepID=UPI003F6017D3